MSRKGIRERSGFGIRPKFIGMVITILVVSAITLSGILIYNITNLLQDELKTRGILLAKKIASNSIYGVATGDSTMLEGFINEIKDEPNLIYVIIIDAGGKILARTNVKEAGKVLNGPLIIKSLGKGEVSFERVSTDDGVMVFDIWTPIFLNDLKVGSVRIGLSSKGVTEKAKEVFWLGFGSTMIVMFFAGLLSYFLVGLVIKPIEEMAWAAECVAEGDFRRRLDISSGDEIGALALSINNMLASLEEKDKELRQNVMDLEALNTTAQLASQSLDLREILDNVLGKALEITGMDAAWVYILDEKDNLLRIAAHRGISTDFVEEIDRLAIGEGIAGRVGSSGEPIIIEDISDDKRLTRKMVIERGFKGFISIPIKSSEKILGAINITSMKRHKPSVKEINLLKGVGNQVGMAVTNSSLYGRLKAKIDELRSTQDQLIHSARLAAVGELAGHVAHEINNPLTGVLGYASLLMEVETDSGRMRQLKIIEEETLRAREIVRKLLDFARQVEPKREKVNINRAIKPILSLVSGHAMSSNIQVVGEYSEGLPDVFVDINQIEQVFLNIINNSMDAMPKGGILAIKSYLSGRYVAVSISDNGNGIQAGMLPRIFDPFFTTKEKVSGAGLGLSVSLGIIERHGGKIDVESLVGQGSKFTVSLPTEEV